MASLGRDASVWARPGNVLNNSCFHNIILHFLLVLGIRAGSTLGDLLDGPYSQGSHLFPSGTFRRV